MEPSGTGTCSQVPTTNGPSSAKSLPLNGAFGSPLAGASKSEDTDVNTGIDCKLQHLNAELSEANTELLVKTKEQRGWRKVIRNFTPS